MFPLDSLKTKKFEPRESEKIGEGSYGKIYLHKSKIYKCIHVMNDQEVRDALDEIEIHNICYQYTKDFQNDITIANIPRIYDVFRTNTSIVIVMQNVGKTFYDVMRSKIKKNVSKKKLLRQVCSVVYQISELLLLLQKKFNFSHRDLHTSNVMLLPSRKKNNCDDQLYKTYIIDFGFARIQKGKKVIHGKTFFKNPKFNPRFDMTLLMFDIFYYTFRCDFNSCKFYLPKEVLEFWISILNSTGVNFKKLMNDDVLDRIGLYHAFMKFHKVSNEMTSIPYIQKKIKEIIHKLCN